MNASGISSGKVITIHDGEVRLSRSEIVRRQTTDPNCSISNVPLERAALVIDEGVQPAEAIALLDTMLMELKASFA